MTDVMMVWLFGGLLLLFLAVLWYLHHQHKKERQAHAHELSTLHEQLSQLQSAHMAELTKLQTQYHDTLTQKNNEHLSKLNKLQQEMMKLTDDFGQKQLIALNQHQTALNQKQALISELNTRLLEQESAFKLSLDKAIKEAQARSTNIQRSVLKGQISEKFVPFMAGFEYSPADCRFMGEPIDYVIFNNLHQCADGEMDLDKVQVIFLEVKSGNAKLNKRQQILQHAIAHHQVRFETLHIDDTHPLPIVYPETHRATPINAGAKWTPQEETSLLQAFDDGMSIQELSKKHGRSEGGIRSRLVKLGRLDEHYG